MWPYLQRLKPVIRHVFERNQLLGAPHGDTHGPRVPRWVHVNQARDTIVANVAASRRQWAGLSVAYELMKAYHKMRKARAKVEAKAAIITPS